MFKSVIIQKYDFETRQMCYRLIDSEFECDFKSSHWVMPLLPAVMKEYKKRNKGIINNLYLFNLFIAKQYGYFCFDELLREQCEYLDAKHPKLNFSSKFKPVLLQMHNNYAALQALTF